jgi:hypothetical protein
MTLPNRVSRVRLTTGPRLHCVEAGASHSASKSSITLEAARPRTMTDAASSY